EDGIRDFHVTGVQTCALPISVCLEAEVRRHGGFGREAAQAARGREPPAEADRRRPGPQPPGAERCPGKQVVTAWARRQVVGKLRAAYHISERRDRKSTRLNSS